MNRLISLFLLCTIVSGSVSAIPKLQLPDNVLNPSLRVAARQRNNALQAALVAQERQRKERATRLARIMLERVREKYMLQSLPSRVLNLENAPALSNRIEASREQHTRDESIATLDAILQDSGSDE